ncbi:MAG TPA: hypothetical protein VMV81_07430, partial [Phycisphaerae bacterium]|nr:hypothetical protein [Phycisphaerae bacterium]
GGGTAALASGGGGGGIIHFLAPSITVGTTSVLGGTKGATGPNLSTNPRTAGAGGGACGGNGGIGDSTSDGMTPLGNQQDGFAGQVLSTLVDPTALF